MLVYIQFINGSEIELYIHKRPKKLKHLTNLIKSLLVKQTGQIVDLLTKIRFDTFSAVIFYSIQNYKGFIVKFQSVYDTTTDDFAKDALRAFTKDGSYGYRQKRQVCKRFKNIVIIVHDSLLVEIKSMEWVRKRNSNHCSHTEERWGIQVVCMNNTCETDGKCLYHSPMNQHPYGYCCPGYGCDGNGNACYCGKSNHNFCKIPELLWDRIIELCPLPTANVA